MCPTWLYVESPRREYLSAFATANSRGTSTQSLPLSCPYHQQARLAVRAATVLSSLPVRQRPYRPTRVRHCNCCVPALASPPHTACQNVANDALPVDPRHTSSLTRWANRLRATLPPSARVTSPEHLSTGEQAETSAELCAVLLACSCAGRNRRRRCCSTPSVGGPGERFYTARAAAAAAVAAEGVAHIRRGLRVRRGLA